MTCRIARTWQTMRFLRREQILSRVGIRLRRRLGLLGESLRDGDFRAVGIRDVPDPVRHRPRPVEPLLDGRLVFHGEEHALDAPPWHDEAVPRLWRYQLHDFEYAQDLIARWRVTGDARACDLFARLAVDWVEKNPPHRGDGWHPYTVSMRLCAWARALAAFRRAIEGRARERIEGSYMEQYAYLLAMPERDVLGNHLLENVRALAVAGLLVRGPLGERGRRRARALLLEQLPRQVLPDGGHYERSPMYHLIVLGAVRETVDALSSAGIPVGDAPGEAIAAMTRFGAAMLGADGEPLPLGDSTGGEAPLIVEPEESTARRTVFAETGYAVLRSSDGRDRVVFDVGDTCPDELPAHAHADSLAFVLERAGRPIFVDPGVGEYAAGPWRDHCRATRAHNTLEIDGADQSDVWAGFRVGERARALSLRADEAGGDVWVEGGHDGYRRRPCRAVHRRRIISHAGGAWTVADRVRSRRSCDVRGHFHLAPDLSLDLTLSGALVRRGGERVTELRWTGFTGAEVVRGEVRPIQGWVFPRFGERRPAPVLVLSGRCEGDARFRLEIDP
jgi:uncharacterized heparinase superfamily protein